MARTRPGDNRRPQRRWRVGRPQVRARRPGWYRRGPGRLRCCAHVGGGGVDHGRDPAEARSTAARVCSRVAFDENVTRAGEGSAARCETFVWTAVVRVEGRAHSAAGPGRSVLGWALLLSVACGAPSAGRPPPSPVRTGVAAASSSTSPSTSYSPTYPGLDQFSDPIDKLSYKLAYTDCLTLGIGELSRSYGGDPADPASVAQAYAATTHASRAGPASQGCLDALRQPPGP
jgi:hypothetical protein